MEVFITYLQVMLLSADQSVDVFPMMPEIVKLLAHSDLLIKKTACHFLCTQAGCQSELMLMTVNTLLKDFTESNPMIRGLALRTMCTVQHEAFAEHRLNCVTKGLRDNSAYVRRTAVMACLSVFRLNPECFLEGGLVDMLYSQIRDPDPIVMVNCLVALEDILHDEGGIVLNKNMVYYLLNKMSSFTAWGMAYTLQILKKYVPKTEDEIFDIMNILDSYLQHNNCTVCISALELFLSLTKDMPHLTLEIFQRSLDSFLSIISSGNVEMMTLILEYLTKNMQMISSCLKAHYKSFFCRHKDPVYLKKQKIKILVDMVSEENKNDILEEMNMNCCDKSSDVSLFAIEAFGTITERFPEMAELCLKMFKKLLESNTEHLVSNTLHVLVSLQLDKTHMENLTDEICSISRNVKDEKGKCAVLNLIGQYCREDPESIYIIEDFVEKLQDDLSFNVKSQLLLTTLQMFCEKPVQVQSILGELLELCMYDSNQDLKDQAVFYYSLINSDVNILKELFSDIHVS